VVKKLPIAIAGYLLVYGRTGLSQLRLDVFSCQDGWSYYRRKIDVGKDWRHFEAVTSLASNAVSVYPTVMWNPAAEGCVLELRAPVLRWYKIVNTGPWKASERGRSE